MTAKSSYTKKPAEQVLKDIRRATQCRSGSCWISAAWPPVG